MFEYFPGNYVWNLAVVATLNSGGLIDEVDRACRPLRDAAARGEDAGTADFLRAWGGLADSLAAQAEAADKAGQVRTAGDLYARATNYLCQAERMQSARAPGRADTYRRVLDLQAKAIARKDPRLSRVAIPYEGTTLPAYFSQAPATERGPAPVIIMWNGLDSTKEHMYSSGHWAELAARGISALMVDCPGSGEALRLQGLTARVDTEAWAGPCVDYLLTRDDVDPAAIGLAGWSLGGYYAPRAAAFEKRLALVVAWGANHDWGAVQRRRLQREGERPVPHYWDHVLWVWGQDSIEDFMELAAQVTLDGVVERITVPFLITHGAGDRQIPLEYAHRSYDQAVNSPQRELRVFTAEEGGAEHIGLDHLPYVSACTADWVAATFAARALPTAGRRPSRRETGVKSRVDGAGWPMMGGVEGAELRFVSLYSGCGGLDLGFARAGMRPVWANDIDGHAVETYNKISKVTDPRWREAAQLFEGHSAIAGDVRHAARDLKPGMADVIVGGPPCQSFSVAGRMDPADPRAQHVFDFLGVVARVRPRAFVMENVAALARNQRWTTIIARLARTAGENYDTRLVVLNACHWGVPQARERMFLVGLPKGHGEIALPGPPTMDAPPTVGDALRALPPLGQPGNTQLCTAKITMARAPVLRGSPFAGMLFNGQGRPVDVNRPAPTLPATMGGNRTPIIDVDQLERDATPWVVGYHHGLTAERRPPLAQLPPQARLRRLTVEEAAAIQTFPADMHWCGPQTARFRQVGNAVPPVLAWHVARAVRTALNPHRR